MKTLLWVAAVLAILIGGLRLAALRWWKIPLDDQELAASIAPTLRGGDWVVLWRLTKPSFGDLVVCPDPENEGYMVIGRIGGEMNDTLRVKGSDLFVNKKKMATESVCNPSKYEVEDPVSHSSVSLSCSIEAMGGVKHMRLSASKAEEVSAEVEAGQLFLISDNRDMPYDSRDYGTLDKDTCKETVVFRIMGPDGLGDVESRFTFIQ